MKKFISICICISLIAAVFIVPASATGGEWSIDSKGYVTAYTGTESVLIVPEEISGMTVKGIGEGAFENNTRIKEITLTETCTYIDNYAFKNCSNLHTINAPGVVTIKKEAFFRCRKLDYVNMPELTNLSQRCFMGAGKLNNLPIENFTVIPQWAFSGSKIMNITFPNVTTIYNNAFSNCRELVEISLPSLRDGELYENVFSGCIKLERVNFPDDMVSLGGGTFEGTYIKDFSFLENIEYVYYRDFSMLVKTETICLPKVKFVDYYAFERNHILKQIILPSCTTVLEQAFYNNPHLEKVILSDELEYVGSGAFANNFSLEYIVLNGLKNSNEDIFKDAYIERVEFNKIQTIASLPVIENSIVALPVTFSSCTENTTGRNYRVFGTKGSYAEEWAIANGHTFLEISQENSIVSDVPVAYDIDSDEPITFDAVGFNSTYQWYGSFDKNVNNEDDVLIEGATLNEYAPGNGEKYPYYYCKMTSTDIDNSGEAVSVVDIYSSICEIYSTDETEIDYANKLVYTNNAENLNLTDMLYVEDGVNCELVPSYVCDGIDYFGTGSVYNLYEEGSVVGRYTVIMKADINGDGVVDALDASGVEKQLNNHSEITGNYYLAADSNRDAVVDIVDYQTAVNMAIA